MKSIRQRLFANFIGISLLLLILIWLSNTLFLTNFYIKREEQTLLESFNRLNALESDAYPASIDLFIEIETSANVDIILYDPNNVMVYSTNTYLAADTITSKVDGRLAGPPRLIEQRKLPAKSDQRQNPVPFENPDVTIVSNQIRLVSGYDPIIDAQSLSLIGTMDNGYDVNLRLPVTSIQTSIGIINQFLLMIGLGLLFIAFLTSILLSAYFTKPIRQINAATKRLKSLDFSEPCLVKTQDELGQLANNVNDMSNELSKAIDSLNASNEQLTHEIAEKNLLDEKRRQLLNNVSHELKTPLSLMEGYAEALQLGIATDPERIDFYCNVIIDETEKMNHLVQSLLNINQIEFGDSPSHPIEMDMVSYIQQSLEKYVYQLEKNKLTLTMNLPEVLWIKIDPIELDQLFINYLSNALHYANSYVHVELSNESMDNLCKVTVSNDCQPLRDDQLSKVWDSFYKVDVARSRSVGGHGLGLSIVKAIQTKHKLGYGSYSINDGVSFWFECHLK